MAAIVTEDIKKILTESKTDSFRGKKVLVSGGAGFLGSYVCESLIGAGAYVTCLDNFATGIKENLAHIVNNAAFRLVNSDVATFETCDKYSFIFHLASRASPEEYQKHPVETLMANSVGSLRLLELAKMADSTILFASTSEVYGDPQVVPTPESYWGNVNPIGPRSCYDEGKRYGEALFMSYFREYGTDIKIARIHNTYGPRLRADGFYARAVSRFILRALRSQDIPVYGDGTQTRSFCYVTDTTKALLEIADKKEAMGEAINVGNAVEISIINLARKILKLTNSTSRIVFHQLPEDDPKRRCPDISKVARLIGWEPNVDLDSGLKRTIEWLKARQ